MDRGIDDAHPVIRRLVEQEFPDISDDTTAYNAGWVMGVADKYYVYRLSQFGEPQSELVQNLCAEIAFWWAMNYLLEQAAGRNKRDLPTATSRLS